MKKIKLSEILNRTDLFYTNNFGVLQAYHIDDMIHFKNTDYTTRLKCNYDSMFDWESVDGRTCLIFETQLARYELFPIEYSFINIGSL